MNNYADYLQEQLQKERREIENRYGPTCHPHGIRSYGDVYSGVMFIGIAPGRHEVREGRPFVGDSGEFLRSLLRAVKWPESKMYATNLICWQNDEPTEAEIEACADRLRGEIESIEPRLIVTLGKLATEAVLRHDFGKATSSVSWVEGVYGTAHNCYVLSTWHPAAALRKSVFAMDIYKDLLKLSTIMSWADGAPLARVEWSTAQGVDDAQAFLDSMVGKEYVSLDVESTMGKDDEGMIDVFRDSLLCVGVSDGERTMVIPANVATRLTYPPVQWLFHNGPFDYQAMRRFCKIKLRIHNDTMLMSYSLDERSGVHRLKRLAREHLAAGWYEANIHFNDPEWVRANLRAIYAYNAKDAAYTARLAPILRDRMVKDNVCHVYDTLLIPATNVMAETGYRGIRIDQDRYNELMMKWGPRFIQAEDDLRAHAEKLGAKAPFNIRSNPQLQKLVFQTLAIDPPRKKYSKKTGNASLDKDVVESMLGMHPFIDELHDFRQLDHTMGNYMLPIRGLIKLDGGVHTYGKLHGAVTGRTAYSAPPMQDIPNPKYDRNAEFGEFREVFIPWNPDTHCIMEADFSRAEMYMAVAYTHDPEMAADLASGDPHAQMAAFAFRKPLVSVTKADRTEAKHVTFGKLFGRQAAALHAAELRAFPLSEVISFCARWDVKYARHIAWMQEIQNKASNEGELVSLMGRKRRFLYISGEDYEWRNQAVNFPIQSGASDCTLTAMVRLAPLLFEYNSYVLLMIHDSLVFEVDNRYKKEVAFLIRSTMEQSQYAGAPAIPMELAIGSNWGNTEEIKDIDAYFASAEKESVLA